MSPTPHAKAPHSKAAHSKAAHSKPAHAKATHPKPAGGASDLSLRLGSSLVLIPIALAAAWWGDFPAYLLVALVATIVFLEWAVVIGQSKTLLPSAVSTLAPAILVGIASLLGGFVSPLAGLAATLLAAVLALLLARSRWLGTGAIYAGLFGTALVSIRRDQIGGLDAVVVLLVAVWASDSCAYFVGRSLGGPKLWPRVSPKKTWSGAIGGLVGGVALAFLAAWLLGVPASLGLLVVLVLLSLASAAGDLAESALKRRFGRKDASAIIPGHGGMMDRVDGLVAAAVLGLAIGWAHQGADAVGRGMLLW